jgi:hypothetical protein
VSQHVPDVHCGTTHAVPEHPYAHVVHHELFVSVWHSCPAVQSVTTCHVASQTRFPAPHVALVPVQYWYW